MKAGLGALVKATWSDDSSEWRDAVRHALTHGWTLGQVEAVLWLCGPLTVMILAMFVLVGILELLGVGHK